MKNARKLNSCPTSKLLTLHAVPVAIKNHLHAIINNNVVANVGSQSMYLGSARSGLTMLAYIPFTIVSPSCFVP
eukprot:3558875-Amphidinium_carterae.2